MMDPKLKLLAEKLKDERSKKVVFVAHCILNENTRYLGGAFRKGCIDEVVDEMQRQGIGIVQMKCPEQKAWGGLLKKYMWQPMSSRNTILYKLKGVFLPFFIWNTRRIYQKIAREIGAEIKDYLESGFEVLGIMGIAGSPSCGVTRALDIRKSFEFLANTDTDDLNRKRMNELGVNELIIEGKGPKKEKHQRQIL
jgi:predicted secreted protein